MTLPASRLTLRFAGPAVGARPSVTLRVLSGRTVSSV